MPKKRKTRKEKISSEQKQMMVQEIIPSTQLSQNNATPSTQKETVVGAMTFSLPTNYHGTKTTHKEKQTAVAVKSISTSEYGYLGNDLIRTALLSGAIVIAELLIRLFFTHL